MNLNDAFLKVRQSLAENSPASISNQNILSLIDLTLLDTNASADDINALQQKGCQHNVAALCILPEHLAYLPAKLSIQVATVANFPTGNANHTDVLSLVEDTITRFSVDEVDYVFPYQRYLEGEVQEALSECKANYQLCREHNVRFKVILETGALPSIEDIYQLSLDVIASGCDFIKTSTGKIATGATLDAAFAMLTAIKESKASCGFKVSGGIKTKAQALAYIHLAEYVLNRPANKHWFRIGASSLVNDLV